MTRGYRLREIQCTRGGHFTNNHYFFQKLGFVRITISWLVLYSRTLTYISNIPIHSCTQMALGYNNIREIQCNMILLDCNSGFSPKHRIKEWQIMERCQFHINLDSSGVILCLQQVSIIQDKDTQNPHIPSPQISIRIGE